MEVCIKSIPEFNRRAKRLSKKYKSLKADIQNLVSSLQKNPIQGNCLGEGVYKIRLSISAKGGGKRGGGRVITYTVKVAEPEQYEVTLLTIYDKSEIENVSEAYTKELIRFAQEQ